MEVSHKDRILDVEFNAAGTQFITASADGTATLWDRISGDRLAIFQHEDWVSKAAFDPGGERVATAANDGMVRVWDVSDGRMMQEFVHDDRVAYVTFSPDGNRIATASTDTTAGIWDIETGERLLTLAHKNPVSVVAFSPDGRFVVTGTWVASDDTNGEAFLWDPVTGKLLASLDHGGAVYNVEFSADGAQTLTAGAGRSGVLIWTDETEFYSDGDWSGWDDPESVEESFSETDESTQSEPEEWVDIGEIHPVGASAVHDASFSSNGRRVLAASYDGIVSVWNASSGDNLLRLKHDEAVRAEFCGRSGKIASGSWDNSVRVWNGESGEPEAILKHDDWVLDIACSADGMHVVSVAKDGSGAVWDISMQRRIAMLQHEQFSKIENMEFSADGQKMLTAIGTHVAIWGVPAGELLQRWDYDAGIFHASIDSDGKRVVLSSYDQTATIWNAETASQLAVLKHEDVVTFSVFSPDGKLAASGSFDGVVGLWDAETGQELAKFELGAPVGFVGFNPDTSRLFAASSAGESIATFWDLSDYSQQFSLTDLGTVQHLTFNPDGSSVVVAGSDRASIWNADTGQHIADLRGAEWVEHLDFSPNGERIVSAASIALAEKGGASVWDASTGERLLDLATDVDVNQVAYSSDGSFIIGATESNAAFVWDAQYGFVIATLEHRAGVAHSLISRGGIIATGSDDGTTSLWLAPPDSNDILANPFKYLPNNRTCLTPQERERFSLPPLTDQQWIERRCEHFTLVN